MAAKQVKKKKKRKKNAKKNKNKNKNNCNEDWSVPKELMIMYDVYTKTAKSILITNEDFVEILSLHVLSILSIFDKLQLLFVNKLFYKLLTSSDSYQRLILDPYYFDITEKYLHQTKNKKAVTKTLRYNFKSTSNSLIDSFKEKQDPIKNTEHFKLNLKTISNLKQFEFRWMQKPKQFKSLFNLLSASPKLHTLIFHEFNNFDDAKNQWINDDIDEQKSNQSYSYFFPFPKMNSLKHLVLSLNCTNNYTPTHTALLFLQQVPAIQSLQILPGTNSENINKILNALCNAKALKLNMLDGLKVLRVSGINLYLLITDKEWNEFVDLLSKWNSNINTLILDFIDARTYSNHVFVRGALRPNLLELMKKCPKLKCVSLSFDKCVKGEMLKIMDSFRIGKDMEEENDKHRLEFTDFGYHNYKLQECFQFHSDLMKQNCDGCSYYKTKEILKNAYKIDKTPAYDYYYHSDVIFKQSFGLFCHK